MNPELHIENLAKVYGARRVLQNLTLSAGGGEIVGIVGSNGSGKSTLLKIIAGLLRPSKGHVKLMHDGQPIVDIVERRRMVGYAAPDLSFYPELSAFENLQFFDRVRGISRPPKEINSLLRRVGLSGREHDVVSAFSSGMKQRLRLGFALLGKAPILLLDEPSLALDKQGVSLVEEIIESHRTQGGLVVLATNDPRETALANRLIPVGPSVPSGDARVLD